MSTIHTDRTKTIGADGPVKPRGKYHLLHVDFHRDPKNGYASAAVLAACDKPNEIERVDFLRRNVAHFYGFGAYRDAETGAPVPAAKVCLACVKSLARKAAAAGATL